jgi:hypothetical protein
MKLELLFILITGFIIYNAYNDNKYVKLFYQYKKHITIGFYVFIAFVFYLIIKRNPMKSREILQQTNQLIQYMPIDKSSKDMLSPIFDFTTNHSNYFSQENLNGNPYGNPNQQNLNMNMERKILQSGQKTNKRSVSETKKKYVASMQNWKCGHCTEQLNHTFEIDHCLSLQNGGTNDVNNLIALCPMCHREKTAMENMNK